MRRGMEIISLWHCSGVMEAQVALIAAFRSSALLGLVSLIFLLTIPYRFSMGFRSGEFAGQSRTVTPWFWTSFWYFWQCGQVPSLAGKWNQHLNKACQQKEAWSALKFPGIWLRPGLTSHSEWVGFFFDSIVSPSLYWGVRTHTDHPKMLFHHIQFFLDVPLYRNTFWPQTFER